MTVSRAGHTALACHSVSSFTTTQCTDSQCVFVCVSPTDSSRNRCTYSLYCIQSFTATDCSPSHNVQAATTAFNRMTTDSLGVDRYLCAATRWTSFHFCCLGWPLVTGQ
ncbi:hypothetical protein NP493_178g03024 [Ridgeia piscesae]|uniref:Uncharacterized protein n=1 Tax=Ridgeia piscesae TaxID=27915 RepID=A0AAD9P2Y8_RIDPI|nr:hypothetical protein NP493_178g03024 [Ridgeia piscesae]